MTERERLAASAMERVRAELGRTSIATDVFAKRVIHLTLDAVSADPTETVSPEMQDALQECIQCFDNMREAVWQAGLEGSSTWDEIAGAADMYGVQDRAKRALNGSKANAV